MVIRWLFREIGGLESNWRNTFVIFLRQTLECLRPPCPIGQFIRKRLNKKPSIWPFPAAYLSCFYAGRTAALARERAYLRRANLFLRTAIEQGRLKTFFIEDYQACIGFFQALQKKVAFTFMRRQKIYLISRDYSISKKSYA